MVDAYIKVFRDIFDKILFPLLNSHRMAEINIRPTSGGMEIGMIINLNDPKEIFEIKIIALEG